MKMKIGEGTYENEDRRKPNIDEDEDWRKPSSWVGGNPEIKFQQS